MQHAGRRKPDVDTGDVVSSDPNSYACAGTIGSIFRIDGNAAATLLCNTLTDNRRRDGTGHLSSTNIPTSTTRRLRLP